MCKWEGEIRLGIKESRCESVNWILMAQDRVQWQDLMIR
jgi:hypothetical protein